ncbi:hypothetical protein [Micromonospora sp. Llam0]|uniref:hypothetical protein n=1 Tax=Micromonospora sp. Llam0 TaxID=2485143 RepID=UPI0011CE4C28|nr:hypothetical protein [Micromonospora sp. Llam0]
MGAAINTGGVPVRIWIWPAETTGSTQLRRLRRDLDGRTVIPVTGPESMLPAGLAEQLGDGRHLWGGPLREAEPAPYPDQVHQTIVNPPGIRGGRRVKEITAAAPGERWIMLSQKAKRRRSKIARPSPDSLDDDKYLDGWHVLHGYGGELTANQLVDGYLQLRALHRELAGPLPDRFGGPPDEAVTSELVVVWLAALLRRTAEIRSGRLWKSLMKKALGQPGRQGGSS